MKKYLVLTDIHGSIKYAQMAFDKFNQYGCHKILILGDILYHGPRNDLPEGYNPKAVTNLCNEYKKDIIAVNGNCDAEVDQMVLEFMLFPEVMLELNGHKFLLTHGHHLEEAESDGYILYGHTHVTKFEDIFLNIGSVSIPKDNHHTYAIIDDEKITAYDLLTDEVIMEAKL